MTPVLAALDLSKSFRNAGALAPALTEVSFEAGEGEIVGLLGINGAGKSTLVRILSTLLRPDSGTARVAGHDILREPGAVRRAIGVAQQEVGLDESRSIHTVLQTHARLYGLDRRAGAQRIGELLDVFRLRGVASRRIRGLSGGMRRKVDLALALVHSPPVVFLDEPTAGLDPPSRIELWQQIRDLRAAGATILLTTQHLEEADRLADRVIVLAEGRIVREGTPAELRESVGESTLALHFEETNEAIRGAACLGDSSRRVGNVVYLPVSGPDEVRNGLEALDAGEIRPLGMRLEEPSLDQLFLGIDPSPRTPAGLRR